MVPEAYSFQQSPKKILHHLMKQSLSLSNYPHLCVSCFSFLVSTQYSSPTGAQEEEVLPSLLQEEGLKLWLTHLGHLAWG